LSSVINDVGGYHEIQEETVEVNEEWFDLTTDYQYTGQRSYLDSFGLHYYVARWYDPVTAHFAQADSIIPQPGNSADWNRYAYALNNPMRYIDPTGHYYVDDIIPGLTNDSSWWSYQNPNQYNKPIIQSRQEWGALDPGPQIIFATGPGGTFPLLVGGEYDGNDFYSVLYPDQSLSDIYDTIVVHHEGNSATNNPYTVQFQTMMDGYWDIPYHFIIGPDGTIYEGRTVTRRGAHVEGANTGKIGVLVLGDYQPGYQVGNWNIPFDFSESSINSAQITSLVNLVVYFDNAYSIDSVVGHRDINDWSVCPGDKLMPVVRFLDLLVK
jgi:RHS repeat-associated protein